MSRKLDPNNRLDRYTVYIAALSLLISICSFALSLHMWHEDRKASISVDCSSHAIDGSYESFSNNGNNFGRYLMAVSVSISNNSSQGCVLDCEPLFKSYKGTPLFPSPEELIFKDGTNPFRSISLEPRSSRSVDFEMYIYFSELTHKLLEDEFGDKLYTTNIQSILRYLYKEGIAGGTAPIIARPMDSTSYDHISPQPQKLILYITTNTGASGTAIVDYLYRDFFDFVYRN